jgi:hypothetical protein
MSTQKKKSFLSKISSDDDSYDWNIKMLRDEAKNTGQLGSARRTYSPAISSPPKSARIPSPRTSPSLTSSPPKSTRIPSPRTSPSRTSSPPKSTRIPSPRTSPSRTSPSRQSSPRKDMLKDVAPDIFNKELLHYLTYKDIKQLAGTSKILQEKTASVLNERRSKEKPWFLYHYGSDTVLSDTKDETIGPNFTTTLLLPEKDYNSDIRNGLTSSGVYLSSRDTKNYLTSSGIQSPGRKTNKMISVFFDNDEKEREWVRKNRIYGAFVGPIQINSPHTQLENINKNRNGRFFPTYDRLAAEKFLDSHLDVDYVVRKGSESPYVITFRNEPVLNRKSIAHMKLNYDFPSGTWYSAINDRFRSKTIKEYIEKLPQYQYWFN